MVGAIDDTHICAEANATASACGGDNGKVFEILCISVQFSRVPSPAPSVIQKLS